MAYTNSPLVSYTKLSPNHSGPRTHVIDRITPHCVVGQCSVETLGDIFAPVSRQASSNYGIGKDGRIALFVEEANRSWCSSSAANDQRAVTIECASDKEDPYWMNSSVYNSLVKLCADICRRNGKGELIWIADREKALAYEPKAGEMLLTVHRWFAAKSCPGDWLYNRLGNLAAEVTRILSSSATAVPEAGVPGDGNVPHEWAKGAVDRAIARGILKGSASGKADYRLNDPVTREEVLVFIDRALGGE